jgi:predicted nucleic acid-binding protein
VLLADSSAWIEYLRGTGSQVNVRLREAIRAGEVVVTDPVMLEVMSGARRELEDRILRLLSEQDYEPVAPRVDWLDAAALYRACRRDGLTVRSNVDCLIAAVAIRRGVPVLHIDRDFDAIATCTTLQLVTPTGS